MGRLRHIAVLALTLSGKAAAQRRPAAALVPRDSLITVAFSEQSAFLTPARLVITDSVLYLTVWDRIASGAPLPAVDFSRYQLVFAAYGPTAGLDTQILIDTIDTQGSVRLWSISLGDGCPAASAYGHPIHLVRIPRSVRIQYFDDRSRIARNCELPITRFPQLRWLETAAHHP